MLFETNVLNLHTISIRLANKWSKKEMMPFWTYNIKSILIYTYAVLILIIIPINDTLNFIPSRIFTLLVLKNSLDKTNKVN